MIETNAAIDEEYSMRKIDTEPQEEKLNTEAAFIKTNINAIVEELSQQFADPEDSYRELSQNAIDSKTKKLNVFSQIENIDDEHSQLTLTFKDFGCGMTQKERDEFFLKLFKSSKEKDKKKIGKYGIGISSIFALNLEELIVSSQSEIQGENGWMMHVKGIENSPSYKFFDKTQEESGTTITLVRKLKTTNIQNQVKKISEKISFFCERSRIPIIINGKNITKPFDLNTEIRISKATDSLEFVIGYDGRSKHEIFNNRLKLEEGILGINKFSENWKGVSILASSYKFKHTFSRDSVIRDDNFASAIDKIHAELPNLFLEALKIYNKHIEENKKNNHEVQRMKIPTFELETKTGISHTFNERNIDHLEKNLKFGVRYNQYKEGAETILRKIQEYRKALDSFDIEVKKKREENKNENSEFIKAKEFISLYLENMRIKASENKKNLIQRIGNKVNILKENKLKDLKKLLPKGTEDYKIIPTYDGTYISITELIEELDKHSNLITLHKNADPELAELIKTTERIIFDSTTLSKPFNSNKGFFYNFKGTSNYIYVSEGFDENISSFIEAIDGKENPHDHYRKQNPVISGETIYVKSIKHDKNLEPYQIEFLKKIHSELKKQKIESYGETYFTKQEMDKILDQATFTKNRSGKIECSEDKITKPKTNIFKKTYQFLTLDFPEYTKDVVLNLNHPTIENALNLYSYGDETSQTTAIRDVMSQINKDTFFYSREYTSAITLVNEKKSCLIERRKKERF